MGWRKRRKREAEKKKKEKAARKIKQYREALNYHAAKF